MSHHNADGTPCGCGSRSGDRTVRLQEKHMDLNDYQAAAVATMARDLEPWKEMATLGLGLSGEAGEVADIVKKLIGHGHPMTPEVREKLVKECGDVLWYVATFSRLVLGLDLRIVAEANIDKLRDRYPEGFSTERSINR